MMRYRKKPIEIEAMQVPEPGYKNKEQADKVMKWLEDGNCKFTTPPTGICIQTLEGDMLASFGDWIIKEPFSNNNRKFYPCKLDIFEKTYELIEG